MAKVTLNLSNFQSHSFTTFSSEAHLVCVTGANDVGKSSLIRAVRWVLEDIRGTSFIRDGESRSEVSLSIDDVTIVRSKGVKENKYIVKGREFNDIGYGAPPEVSQALNLSPLKFDQGLEVNLTLSDQLDSHFLLFEPSSVRAKFLGSLTGANKIDAALKETNRKLNECKSNQKELHVREEVLNSSLVPYSDLEQERLCLEKIEGLLSQIKGVVKKLNVLEGMRDRVEEYSNQILDIHFRKAQIQEVYLLLSRFDKDKKRIEECIEKVNQLQIIKHTWERLAEERSVIMDKWSQSLERRRAYENVYIVKDSILDMIDRALSLKSIKEQLQVSTSTVTSIHTRLVDTEHQIQGCEALLQRDKDQYRKELQVSQICPTCNSPITPETLERCLASV